MPGAKSVVLNEQRLLFPYSLPQSFQSQTTYDNQANDPGCHDDNRAHPAAYAGPASPSAARTGT